jgi:hypothetical protein
MKRALFLLSAVVLLAQPALAKTKLRCSKLVAESDGKSKVATFSATAVLDVDLLVQFTPGHAKALADEDHWIEVRFFGPQGFLYESRMVPLTSDPRQASSAKSFHGYPRALGRKLVKASKSGKELEVSVPLPVAATSIVESSLYGTWRAEAYLDDSTEPCTEPLAFVITQ